MCEFILYKYVIYIKVFEGKKEEKVLIDIIRESGSIKIVYMCLK